MLREYEGVIKTQQGKSIRFPLAPFMGIMGVAANTSEPVIQFHLLSLAEILILTS